MWTRDNRFRSVLALVVAGDPLPTQILDPDKQFVAFSYMAHLVIYSLA